MYITYHNNVDKPEKLYINMTMVDIDNELYQKIGKAIKNNKVEYPSVKNFIDKSIKNNLEKIKDDTQTKKPN